ncbi:MAG: GerMN domain-containing protein [Spirochaetaceae bacterium]|jgi:hypothetical protein|nr:GerMN domain-containing protein [Spirochaetaceae bacterium]
MARRLPARNNKSGRKLSVAAVFWILFIILIVFLFLANRGVIMENVEKTGFGRRLFNRPAQTTDQESPPAPPLGGERAFGGAGAEAPERARPPDNAPPPAGLPFNPAFPFGTDNSADVQAVVPGDGVTPADSRQVPRERDEFRERGEFRERDEFRERTLYFVNVDSSGMVFLSPVKRRFSASAAPLYEAITSLLAGPAGAEKNSGLTSLIPSGVRLINARVQGNTAYLNFNEDFLYNTYDAEGYYAQLRQIVWTATEFPNVRNVQILIDNRKVDFLGLTIRIDKPLGRESL